MKTNNMKKQKIDFAKLGEIDELQFGDHTVSVKKYLSWEDQQIIIGTYVDIYFNKGMFGNETDYTGAERMFNYSILELATSVDPTLKKFFIEDDNMILDYVNESGLMTMVRSKIANLSQTRKMIERIVADKKQEMFSAKGLMSQLIKSVGEEDFLKVKELAEQVKDVQEMVEESPISSLMDEGKSKGS